jgi:hypothetical protein
MPIELDRGHDEPIFGPNGLRDFADRHREANEIALKYGRQARLAASRLDGEIRAKLAAYLVGRSTLDDFASWFASVEATAAASVNPAARALAGLISVRLASHAEGHLNEADLKRLLGPHAFLQVDRDPMVPRVWTASATKTVRSPLVAV